MKMTFDNEEVPDWCWYYLLAWNENNKWVTIQSLFGQKSLQALSGREFWKLFKTATDLDLTTYSKPKFDLTAAERHNKGKE